MTICENDDLSVKTHLFVIMCSDILVSLQYMISRFTHCGDELWHSTDLNTKEESYFNSLHSINRNNIDWLWWRTWINMIGLKINKNSNCQEANTILLCSPATKKTTTNYKEESLLCILSWFIKMKRVYSWASLQYSGCWLQLFNCVMCEGLPHRIVGDGKITISQSQSQFLPAQKSLKNIV